MARSSTRRKLNPYGKFLKANKVEQKKIYWKFRKSTRNHRKALGKTGKKMASLWRSSKKRRPSRKSGKSTSGRRCSKGVVQTGPRKGKCRTKKRSSSSKKKRKSTRRPSRTKSGRCPKGVVKTGRYKGKCKKRKSSK